MSGGEARSGDGDAVVVVDTEEGRSPRLSRRRVAAWLASLAVIAAVIGVVVQRADRPSPEEELAGIRSFVTSAGTGRFEGTSRSEYGSGADEPGSTSIDVSHFEGSFVLPGRLHYSEDSGGYVVETVNLHAGSYFRGGDSRQELADERWTYTKFDEGGAGAGEVSMISIGATGEPAALAAGSSFLGALGAPFDLAAILDRLGDVERPAPGVLEASLTLRQFLPGDLVAEMEEEATKLAEAAAEEGDADDVDEFLDGAVVVRLMHDDGRLDQLEMTFTTGKGEDRSVDRATLRFTGWGESITIEAPEASRVDATPGIEEEDLAGFTAFPVLAPAAPPAGMLLQYAEVVEEEPDEETCASVELGYGPQSPDDDEDDDASFGRFLRISEYSATCPWADEAGSIFFAGGGEPTSVRVGPYEGELRDTTFPGDDGETLISVRFRAGDVTVDVESALPADQVLAVLGTIGPLDLAVQPVERSEPPPSG